MNIRKIIKGIAMACFVFCILTASCFASEDFDFGGRIDEVKAMAEKDKSIRKQGLVVHGIIPEGFFDKNLQIGKMRQVLLQRRWTNDEIDSFYREFMPARLLSKRIHKDVTRLFYSLFYDDNILEDCFWDYDFLEAMSLFADVIEGVINEEDDNACYLLEGRMWDYMNKGNFSRIVLEIEKRCESRPCYEDVERLGALRKMIRH